MLNIDALTALTNLPIATQVIILGTAHCLLGSPPRRSPTNGGNCDPFQSDRL
ncbi:hypothetical protein IQ218_08035 [Synechocystis salina LEGE 06099]|uniref:hypothetical protein n=1 Tax=Synechocystis salina TaxID=945780 RepID=UPI00187FE3DB|nr:hypothetical protein [Synechocystis salina]MBE9203407.1 hypothetical protein [Synechocystis salina LEGE 06099]